MPKKILVAEDDVFLGRIYRTKFVKAGFDVSLAVDGLDATNQASNMKFDLILLDMVMPRKDGFEALADIRKDPKYKDTPIIIVSNLGQKEDKDRALSLGATEYLVKSDIPLNDLINKINSYLL